MVGLVDAHEHGQGSEQNRLNLRPVIPPWVIEKLEEVWCVEGYFGRDNDGAGPVPVDLTPRYRDGSMAEVRPGFVTDDLIYPRGLCKEARIDACPVDIRVLGQAGIFPTRNGTFVDAAGQCRALEPEAEDAVAGP